MISASDVTEEASPERRELPLTCPFLRPILKDFFLPLAVLLPVLVTSLKVSCSILASSLLEARSVRVPLSSISRNLFRSVASARAAFRTPSDDS